MWYVISPLTSSFGSSGLMIFSMTNSRISSWRDLGRVLRGDDDRVDPHRLVAVVLDRHLALAVGPQPVDFALLAGFGQPVEDLVGQAIGSGISSGVSLQA